MTWIAIMNAVDADDRLSQTDARIAGPTGEVDNILLAHSLRPHIRAGCWTMTTGTPSSFGPFAAVSSRTLSRGRDVAALRYTGKLTVSPRAVGEADWHGR